MATLGSPQRAEKGIISRSPSTVVKGPRIVTGVRQQMVTALLGQVPTKGTRAICINKGTLVKGRNACAPPICVARPFAAYVTCSGMKEALRPVEVEAANKVCAAVSQAYP